MSTLLKVDHLKKSYKEREVVHGISFDILEGEILCFLGPNGAGKSTTINILCGALGYETGEILYKNQLIEDDVRSYKAILGVVPQELALYEDLTAEKNVAFFASLYGLRGAELQAGIDFALQSVGLLTHRKEKARTFSGGMKRRLNIACAIAHRPQLLIMDEPTVGIDPQSRNHILEAIRDMNKKGMTIIYTTHYMEEVEEISTRIIIMDHGSIIAEGTTESLKENSGSKKMIIEIDDAAGFDCMPLHQLEGITECRRQENQLIILSEPHTENLDKIIGVLLKADQKIKNITLQSNSLETVFLELTGRSLRD